MKERETIKHAAIKTLDNWTFIGKCHADCFYKAINIGKEPDLSNKAEDQGFVTNKGRFVTRDVGAKIALRSKQCVRVCGGILCSEDLWSHEHNGRFSYCEIKGYYLKD